MEAINAFYSNGLYYFFYQKFRGIVGTKGTHFVQGVYEQQNSIYEFNHTQIFSSYPRKVKVRVK